MPVRGYGRYSSARQRCTARPETAPAAKAHTPGCAAPVLVCGSWSAPAYSGTNPPAKWRSAPASGWRHIAWHPLRGWRSPAPDKSEWDPPLRREAPSPSVAVKTRSAWGRGLCRPPGAAGRRGGRAALRCHGPAVSSPAVAYPGLVLLAVCRGSQVAVQVVQVLAQLLYYRACRVILQGFSQSQIV